MYEIDLFADVEKVLPSKWRCKMLANEMKLALEVLKMHSNQWN